ncbi:prealbumin-like fold domain-containing protein [Bifidobacterium sp.]|uniref:prealbumin-like fold domain-containing protein n=1 Tax=Bifidobacterium sp. TaxID=41200 RepID=UPI0039EAD973
MGKILPKLLQHRMLRMMCVATIVTAVLVAVAVSSSESAHADDTGTTSIVIEGDAVSGHTFRAMRIAQYSEVELSSDSTPQRVGLQTVEGDATESKTVLSDGSFVGGPDRPLTFKQLLAHEVSALYHAQSSSNKRPEVSDSGEVMSLESSVTWKDPLVWAGNQWQRQVTEADSDPWLNTNTQTVGAIRTLTDWLAMESGINCESASCMGIDNVTSSGEVETDGVIRVRFEGLQPGLYIVIAVETSASPEVQSTTTRSSPMVIGTKIPVTTQGVTEFHDLGNHGLGTMNVKGDAVNASLLIDDEAQNKERTYASGDEVPFVFSTNLPNYDTYSHGAATGSYRDGRISGDISSSGTTLLNRFGNPAGKIATSTSTYGGEGGKPVDYRRSASDGTTRGLGLEVPDALVAADKVLPAEGTLDREGAVHSQQVDTHTYDSSPLRFDIIIDYDRNFNNVNPRSIQVSLGDVNLSYMDVCPIDNKNVETPCFGFVQSLANAQGERYFIVQLPSWTLHSHGGEAVQMRYRQAAVVSDAESDVFVTKPTCSASIEFSNDPLSDDYSDFSLSQEFGRIFLSQHLYLFSYGMKLTKIDSKTDRVLKGAEFQFESEGVLQCFRFVKGSYIRSGSKVCGAKETDRVVSGDDGSAVIRGLSSHAEYRVQELRQPAGYHASNVGTIDFTIRINPTFDVESWPTAVLAAEFVYSGASYMDSWGLPSYLRPAMTDWVDDVDHIKHTIYAHEVSVLNGASERDVEAIAPFAWDVLAKTGIGLLAFICLAVLLMLLGRLIKWRQRASRHYGPRTAMPLRRERSDHKLE